MIRPRSGGQQMASRSSRMLYARPELAANVVVAAGPGAGKTELLAQRADFLLDDGHLPLSATHPGHLGSRRTARNIQERAPLHGYGMRLDKATFQRLAGRIKTTTTESC